MMREAFSSLSFSPQRLGEDGLNLTYEATQADLAALSERLGVDEVVFFRAELTARPEGRLGARVEGRLSANVRQTSVVSLDPVVTELREDVRLSFRPEGSSSALLERDLDFDPEEDEDPPEIYAGDRIDLKPYLLEFLSLALDPYPRAEGETFEAPDADPEPEAGRPSPFADLDKRLKSRDEQ